jgi:microcompartment protein CcmK/EutM
MLLAKIVGTVVATRKDPRLVSNKLLLARPVDPKASRRQLPRRHRYGRRRCRRNRVDCQRQLGAHGAGMKDTPVDAAVVGIIDAVDVPSRSRSCRWLA